MDRLARIEVFIRVTEDGGFSAAARSLGITQSSASKAISELEARLRTRLFNRTTRTISLTSSGSSYYKKMKRLIYLLEEAEEEASSEQKNFQGRLRINTSTITSEKLVIPALMGFKEKFPEIDIEITMDDRRIDLVSQPTDIAVRIGPLSDSTLRARRAGKAPMGLFASPDYLDRTGPGTESLSDLSGHQMIQFSDRKTINLLESLAGIEENTDDKLSPSITVSNIPLAKYAALAGSGLAILPHFFVVDEVRENRLVQIMPKLDLPSMEVSLVNPFSRVAPKRVTAFVDYAIDFWRKEGLLEV